MVLRSCLIHKEEKTEAELQDCISSTGYGILSLLKVPVDDNETCLNSQDEMKNKNEQWQFIISFETLEKLPGV